MESITKRFIDYLFSKADDIDERIIAKASLCLEDYLAVTEAGARKNREHWKVLLEKLPDGKAEIVGYGMKTDPKSAALINGFNAHTLELDDGQRFAMIHLGAAVISALLAVKEETGKEDLLKGIVMGYEAACRTAIVMQPSHKELGFHATGTCGTVGAAVAVAFALKMDREAMNRVLACACAGAAGLLEMQSDSSELKPYNPGRAAMDGLAAAYMGYTDLMTPDDILGGERGLFRLFAKEYEVDKLTEKNEYFEIERIYVKPYASCRHSHSAVEAAIRIHNRINDKEISEVLVTTYRVAVKGHDHTEIPGSASARLSIPYAVAAGLLYGRADLTVFEPLDEKIMKTAGKVKVEEDRNYTEQCPEKRIARVTVRYTDGSLDEEIVEYAKGEAENPLSEAERKEKIDLLGKYQANEVLR